MTEVETRTDNPNKKQSRQIGLAVFVKTPQVTPLKTRLAESIGKKNAEEFYLRSCAAIRSVIRLVPRIKPYWAVSEADQFSYWKKLTNDTCCWQGEGGLAPRLSKVHHDLFKEHGAALLLGADCPQMTADALTKSLKALDQELPQVIVGPATDGGFYLFGSNFCIPKIVWEAVTYSTDTTLDQLLSQLRSYHQVPEYCLTRLPTLSDVDYQTDLERAAAQFPLPESMTSEQAELFKFIKNLLVSPRQGPR